MSNFLKTAWARMIEASERRAIEVTRRELERLDDRTLEDIGVSRALLAHGANAWPWRTDDEDVLTPATDDAPALPVRDADAPTHPVVNESRELDQAA